MAIVTRIAVIYALLYSFTSLVGGEGERDVLIGLMRGVGGFKGEWIVSYSEEPNEGKYAGLLNHFREERRTIDKKNLADLNLVDRNIQEVLRMQKEGLRAESKVAGFYRNESNYYFERTYVKHGSVFKNMMRDGVLYVLNVSDGSVGIHNDRNGVNINDLMGVCYPSLGLKSYLAKWHDFAVEGGHAEKNLFVGYLPKTKERVDIVIEKTPPFRLTGIEESLQAIKNESKKVVTKRLSVVYDGVLPAGAVLEEYDLQGKKKYSITAKRVSGVEIKEAVEVPALILKPDYQIIDYRINPPANIDARSILP